MERFSLHVLLMYSHAILATEMLNSVELHGQDVKEHFEQIAQRLQLLQKLLSDSSLFLPGYNLRSSQQVVIIS